MNSARTPTLGEVINRGLQLLSKNLFAVRIGRIERFDAASGVADVQPLQQEVRESDGADTVYTLAVVPNVPVFCMGGGGWADTYPITKGDECLLLICDRSIDLWYDRGGISDPVDLRRHNITDAFALVGLRNSARALSEWPTDRREIGKQGAPRVALKSDSVHLGVDSGQDATDMVALASLVKSELNALRTALNNLVTTFNSHMHPVPSVGLVSATPGSPVTGAAVSTPPTSAGTPANPINDVKSATVYSK